MSEQAARVSDMHTCPGMEVMITGPGTNTMVPHVGGPILPPGAPTVFIVGLPAATLGDHCTCQGPYQAVIVDTIVSGSSTVMINAKPAAWRGDRTAHNGVIVAGAPTVMIG
jgi:uncharacterized Zn-binding protein involved in type VI secretion